MSIYSYNQGAPAGSAQVPIFDTVNGQPRRVSMSQLANFVALQMQSEGYSMVLNTVGIPDDSVGVDGQLAVDADAGVLYLKSSGHWAIYAGGGGTPAPVFTSQPSISGTSQVGQVLSRTNGAASNTTALTGQWYMDGAVIVGETGATYTPITADIGKVPGFRNFASGPGGGPVQSNLVTTSAVIAAGGGVTVPGAPADVSATAGDGAASATWTAAPANGAAVDNHRMRWNGGTAVETGSASLAGTIPAANGTPGTLEVAAHNSAGWGDWSAASNSVTPQAAVTGLLKNAAKVSSMIAAIKASGTQRTAIAVHGHSIPAGAGSNGTNTSTAADALAWRTSSLFARVGTKLNAGAFSVGIEGLGGGHEALFSVAGGAAKAAAFNLAGVAGKVITLSASGQSMSFVARGAAVRVYGYASAAGVISRYQINGGTVTDATPAGSTGTGVSGTVWYEYVISGLTSGDTVTLLGPTTGTTRVSMVDLNYLTTPGLSMHRLSDPGQMGVQVVSAYLDSTDTQPATPNNNWLAAGQQATMKPPQMASITTRIGIAGAFSMFDVNDIKAFNYAGQAWSWTLADVKRHFQNYVTYMAGLGLPVIAVLGPLRDPAASDTAGTPYTQADIINAYKEVSDASTNCAYIDLTERWTGANLAARYAQQQASGLIYDTVHPNAAGAEAFATDIADAILAA